MNTSEVIIIPVIDKAIGSVFKNWHVSGPTSFPITLICHDRSSLTRHESRLVGHDSSRFICRSIERTSFIDVPLRGAFTRRAFRSRIVPSRNFKSNIVSKSWQHGPAVNRTDRLARNPRGKVNLSFVTKRDQSNEPTAHHAKAINSPIYYPESTPIKTAKEESVTGTVTMAKWKETVLGRKKKSWKKEFSLFLVWFIMHSTEMGHVNIARDATANVDLYVDSG